MKKINLIAMIGLPLVALFSSCSNEYSQDLDIDLNPSQSYTLAPVRDWSLTKQDVKAKEADDGFVLSYDENDVQIYESGSEDEVYHIYGYSGDGKLNASAVNYSGSFDDPITNLLTSVREMKFEGKKGDMQIYSDADAGIVAAFQLLSLPDEKTYVNVGFSGYEPSHGEDDDPDDPDAPYVDLGLSVRWANCNYGADSPQEEGKYFAWSEVQTKDEYWRENYEFCTKIDSYTFKFDNPRKEISGTNYDPATRYMGDDWRMPTKDEANELIYKCEWSYTTIDGVAGYTVTGPNGNSIFFPRTPYIHGTKRGGHNQIWTGSSVSNTSSEAYVIEFPTRINDDKPKLTTWGKFDGQVFRPVYDPK